MNNTININGRLYRDVSDMDLSKLTEFEEKFGWLENSIRKYHARFEAQYRNAKESNHIYNIVEAEGGLRALNHIMDELKAIESSFE